MDEMIGFVLGLIVGAGLAFMILSSFGNQTQTFSYREPIKVSNTEKWEWVDYKGRKRYIIVTREVH